MIGRIGADEYLSLELRAHELLRDIPLYDVTVVDLPGGGANRSLADVRSLESAAPASWIATTLYRMRLGLGRVFGWDRTRLRPEESLLSRLTERDLQESLIAPGSPEGPFLILYQFPRESLIEIRNATVHGWVSTAMAPTTSGYRLYLAVYVRPVSWLTRPYLIAIEPFRRFLMYPAMLRRTRRAWAAAYTILDPWT